MTKEEKWQMFWIGYMESYIEGIYNSTIGTSYTILRPVFSLTELKLNAKREFNQTYGEG